jgi:hypothetical protein
MASGEGVGESLFGTDTGFPFGMGWLATDSVDVGVLPIRDAVESCETVHIDLLK